MLRHLSKREGILYLLIFVEFKSNLSKKFKTNIILARICCILFIYDHLIKLDENSCSKIKKLPYYKCSFHFWLLFVLNLKYSIVPPNYKRSIFIVKRWNEHTRIYLCYLILIFIWNRCGSGQRSRATWSFSKKFRNVKGRTYDVGGNIFRIDAEKSNNIFFTYETSRMQSNECYEMLEKQYKHPDRKSL